MENPAQAKYGPFDAALDSAQGLTPDEKQAVWQEVQGIGLRVLAQRKILDFSPRIPAEEQLHIMADEREQAEKVQSSQQESKNRQKSGVRAQKMRIDSDVNEMMMWKQGDAEEFHKRFINSLQTSCKKLDKSVDELHQRNLEAQLRSRDDEEDRKALRTSTEELQQIVLAMHSQQH